VKLPFEALRELLASRLDFRFPLTFCTRWVDATSLGHSVNATSCPFASFFPFAELLFPSLFGFGRGIPLRGEHALFLGFSFFPPFPDGAPIFLSRWPRLALLGSHKRPRFPQWRRFFFLPDSRVFLHGVSSSPPSPLPFVVPQKPLVRPRAPFGSVFPVPQFPERCPLQVLLRASFCPLPLRSPPPPPGASGPRPLFVIYSFSGCAGLRHRGIFFAFRSAQKKKL